MSEPEDLVEAVGALRPGSVIGPGELIGLEFGMILWHVLRDVDQRQARAAMATFAVDQETRAAALEARSNKLVEIGSQATFPAGLARVDGAFVAATIAVTEEDFVLLDARAELEPTKELARIPRRAVAGARIVDADGQAVPDDSIDPVRELETGMEGYTLILERRDANGTLPPVGLLFRSGEPAMAARERFRSFLEPSST